ncbi:MAG: HEPN domain-containing protein [Nanoarchaeota archaeon]
MTKQSFLIRLNKESKIEIVEPSEEMKESYLHKAEDCLKSAKVLLENKLYENSVINAYYTMYNSLTALLFKSGIKCENHSASIILLEILFEEKELSKVIQEAKEERLDKQYYIDDQKNINRNEKSTKELIIKAEDFFIKIRLVINKVSVQDIKELRSKLNNLFNKI